MNVGYREPSLARRPLDIEIDGNVSYLQKKKPSYNIYRWEAITSGIKNALLTKHLNSILSWKLTSDRVFGASDSRDNRNIVLSSIFPEFFIDFRDNPITPKRGFYTRLKYEIGHKAIGSTFDFWEISGRTIIFFPLFWGVNYFPTIGAGYLVSMENETIPIEKRYFLGGRNTMRGYDSDSMGIKSEGKALGGNAFWNLRNNLKIPVYAGLHLLLFHDMGQLYYREYPETELRHASGFGFLYDSPIGSINAEFGFKLNKDEDEGLWEFHFSIGNF